MTPLAGDSPDWDEQDHEQREDHLHIGDGVHAKSAQQQQLQDLQEGEVVDLPLGHFADVVGGRVRRLQRGETTTGQQRPTNQPTKSDWRGMTTATPVSVKMKPLLFIWTH